MRVQLEMCRHSICLEQALQAVLRLSILETYRHSIHLKNVQVVRLQRGAEWQVCQNPLGERRKGDLRAISARAVLPKRIFQMYWVWELIRRLLLWFRGSSIARSHISSNSSHLKWIKARVHCSIRVCVSDSLDPMRALVGGLMTYGVTAENADMCQG